MKLISERTKRAYPDYLQFEGGKYDYLRKKWDQESPANEKGSDVPASADRTMKWLQDHLCDGIVVGAGQWRRLAVDASWWPYVHSEIMKAQGDWATLRKRMQALIKSKLDQINNYESF